MTSQNAQIRPLPILTVVGMRVRVKPMSAQISQVWESFLTRIDEIAYRIDPDVTVGVMGHWDQALNQFDYQAGVLVSDARTVPSGMVRWEVPAAMYAVFDATPATISDVFEQVPAQLYDLGYHLLLLLKWSARRRSYLRYIIFSRLNRSHRRRPPMRSTSIQCSAYLTPANFYLRTIRILLDQKGIFYLCYQNKSKIQKQDHTGKTRPPATR